MARTEAGISASRRFTSDVTLPLSPLRTMISSTLERGAATLAAIWGRKERVMSTEPRSHRARTLRACSQPGNSPPLTRSRGEPPPPHLRQRVQHQRQLGGLPVALESFGLQLHPLGFCHPDGLNHKGLRFSHLADLFCLCLSHEDLPHPGEGKPSPPAAETPKSHPAALPPLALCLPSRSSLSALLPPHPDPAPSRGQDQTLRPGRGSLTSLPRRSAGCGRLRPRPAASRWRSAPSPSG